MRCFDYKFLICYSLYGGLNLFTNILMSDEEKKPSGFLIMIALIIESLILLKAIDWINKNGWDDHEASITFLSASLAIIYTLYRGSKLLGDWSVSDVISWDLIKNLLTLIFFILGIYFIGSIILNFYTRRNQEFELLNFEGLQLDVAYKKAKEYRLSLVIEDSIFSLNHPPHTILEQDPAPLSRVKPYRNIYLKVTKKDPDWIELPVLSKEQDYNEYAQKLEDSYNILSRIKERRFHSRLPQNTILSIYFEGKKISANDIKRGVKVPMGSTLEFVLSDRGSGKVLMPQLVCRGFDEAKFLLANFKLKPGNIYGEVSDRNKVYVWKQDPPYESNKNIPVGTAVDLYLSSEKPSGCN